MSKANLLDKFQLYTLLLVECSTSFIDDTQTHLDSFRNAIHCLDNSKDCCDNVDCCISQIPNLVQLLHCHVYLSTIACIQYGSNRNWMWLIANFKDIVRWHKSQTSPSRLKIINGLPHVSFWCKYQRCQSILAMLHLQEPWYEFNSLFDYLLPLTFS